MIAALAVAGAFAAGVALVLLLVALRRAWAALREAVDRGRICW